MNITTAALLGAFAGFTIYLGLPFARLANPPRTRQSFLISLATGILIFLLWDILSQATAPVEGALEAARSGNPAPFILLLLLFFGGFGAGLLTLVYFEKNRRDNGDPKPVAVDPARLSLMIATGIGLHNFSEGLAIGQSISANAFSLAAILIIGFAAHNATEGFGITGPLTASGKQPSWKFLGLVGLIGGGPTFLGTMIGYSLHSDYVFVLFLALAAGSILYVISELLHVGRGLGSRKLAMWGIFAGFLLGYATDLILVWAGV